MSIELSTPTVVNAATATRAIHGRQTTAVSFEFDWSAGLTATIGLQFSNRVDPLETDWKTLTGLTTSWTTQPAGTAGGVMYTVNGISARRYRVNVTGVTGSGTLEININSTTEG